MDKNSIIVAEWCSYDAEEKEKALVALIAEINVILEETRKFIDNAFRDGTIKTIGTDIDKIIPPVSRFGNSNCVEKK